MCGRYYIAIDDDDLREISEEVERRVNAFSEPIPLKTRGEIFPTDVVPVQTGIGRYVPMKWGFVNFDKKLIINARSETALQKPMFKKPLTESRCLVPASGYYEWKPQDGKKIKYYFYVPDGPVYFAACYRQEKDSPLRNFVILTRQAVNGLEDFHDRMPVIIPRAHAERWLHETPDVMESAVTSLMYKQAV